MTKQQKFYCKVGQVVCEGLGLIAFSMMWAGIIMAFLVR